MTQGHIRLARPFKLGKFPRKLDSHSENLESLLLFTLLPWWCFHCRWRFKVEKLGANSISLSCKIPMSSQRKMTRSQGLQKNVKVTIDRMWWQENISTFFLCWIEWLDGKLYDYWSPSLPHLLYAKIKIVWDFGIWCKYISKWTNLIILMRENSSLYVVKIESSFGPGK